MNGKGYLTGYADCMIVCVNDISGRDTYKQYMGTLVTYCFQESAGVWGAGQRPKLRAIPFQ